MMKFFRTSKVVMMRRDTFLNFALEMFVILDGLSCKRMFGGYGLYCSGVHVDILKDNEVLLILTSTATLQ
jgi:TfoX/Sxy family transcriptional regulator of competence genes